MICDSVEEYLKYMRQFNGNIEKNNNEEYMMFGFITEEREFYNLRVRSVQVFQNEFNDKDLSDRVLKAIREINCPQNLLDDIEAARKLNQL